MQILLFSGCEYSLKNKGDQAMLEGLVKWIYSFNSDPNLIAYEMTEGALQSISGIKTAPSPEKYILYKTPQDSNYSLTKERLRLIKKGLKLIIHYLLYKHLNKPVNDQILKIFFSHLSDANGVIFSGGGYLNGIWWADGLYSKTFPALAARLAGVPVILTSQALGPFYHPIDKFVAWLLFSSCTRIGVRDGDQSKYTVQKISRQASKRVITTGDDAIEIPAPSELEIHLTLKENGIELNDCKLIAINLRDSSKYQKGYSKPMFSKIAIFLDRLLEQGNTHILFIPISYNKEDDDRNSAQNIISIMKHPDKTTIITKEYPPSFIKGLIRRSHIVVGTSYHFLLFALSQNIPAIALYQNKYYSHKLNGLFELYEQNNLCFDLSEISDNDLYIFANNLLDKHQTTTLDLISKNHLLQKRFISSRFEIIEALNDK